MPSNVLLKQSNSPQSVMCERVSQFREGVMDDGEARKAVGVELRAGCVREAGASLKLSAAWVRRCRCLGNMSA